MENELKHGGCKHGGGENLSKLFFEKLSQWKMNLSIVGQRGKWGVGRE